MTQQAELSLGWLNVQLAFHRRFLLQLARRQLKDSAAAEDAVQETLLAAWQNQDKFEERSAVRTWLVGILKFKLIDAIRRQKYYPVPLSTYHHEIGDLDFDALFDADGGWQDTPSLWPRVERDPAEIFGQKQMLTLLEACLTRLPPQTARIFLMQEYLGMESGEVNKLTGLKSGHVRVLLYRARMVLRNCLDFQFNGHRS